MGDFKKSQKVDSNKSGESSDLESLIQDIEAAEQEADMQIQTLETKMDDIKDLEEKLNSVTEKLSEVEGEALQVAQQEIADKKQQKEDEAEECRNRLEEIKNEIGEKQDQISEEIGKRDEALSELQTAEQDCDVDLSEAKEAVNDERDALEDANSSIEQLLGKISGALTDNQAEKTTEFADSLDYQVTLDYLQENGFARIEAIDEHNSSLGFINITKDADGRVRVQDTQVATKYQGKGIGTNLFKTAEKKVSDGTVLYLGYNDAPDFWKKMGFQSQKSDDGRIEYLKTVSHKRNSITS